ncbi:MAG: FHA domain-containing protein [Acidobacteria bacterium]|nr:MAG: FHA domain-containing protein [Acidobacteriota bacterium]REK03312.1 MAG: FHA domain-containing protein [Acidobacteriota bacterium]
MSQPTPARLFGKYGPFKGLEVSVGDLITIGRGHGNDVVLADPAVSQRHARIQWDPEAVRFVLHDEGSSNGTRVDGMPVRGPTPLGDVAIIGFAGVGELIFSGPAAGGAVAPLFAGEHDTTDVPDRTTISEGPEFLADVLSRIPEAQEASPDRTVVGMEAPVLPGALGGGRPEDDASAGQRAGSPPVAESAESRQPGQPVAETPAAEAAPGPVGQRAARPPAVRPSGGRWVLVVRVEEPRAQQYRFPLARGSHVLGRGTKAELRIDHPHLSRSHARFDVGDTVAVEDLGSSNRTFVEGREIDHRTELDEGAHLAFGDVRAELEYEPP